MIAGTIALCFLLIGGAFLQVYQEFDGNAAFPADCGLVFGAAVYNGYPGPAIVRRVATAADLYKNGQIKTLILCGGRGEAGRPSEAAVMKNEALKYGVNDTDIVLEQESHSTEENLLNSKNLTSQCSTVVGISDGYHLARIRLLAERIGWNELQTTPSQMRPQEASERASVMREVFAYLYYNFSMDHWFNAAALEKLFKDFSRKGFIPRHILKTALAPVSLLT